MREMNVLRAAEALFASQGDDKNKVLASFIDNKDVRTRVKDQGRALLILERLVLPTGKFSYTKEEMHLALLKKLEKKGHRIQADDAEDDEQYKQEKEQFVTERQAMVSDVLGKTVEEVEQAKALCGNLSPIHGFSCILKKGHDQSTEQAEFKHQSEHGVTWGYGGFAENQEKEPEVELTEEEQQQLEEALEIQKRLLDDLPDVPEVEDIVNGIQIQPLTGETPNQEEADLPEVAWQLIGQAYIDGIRTGRNSA